MNFESVILKYRNVSFSERDKGTRFERLIAAYLQTDPKYATQLNKVWLWSDFPYRDQIATIDTGIDIVALDFRGDFWAIQCKCYDETTQISKADVDTFLSTSGKYFFDETKEKRYFMQRLFVSTTNNWSSVAEDTIKNQTPPVLRLNLHELESAPVDWQHIEEGLSGTAARDKKKTPREHQLKAIQKVHEHFVSADRGKLIMACGTGKTFTSLKIAENETDSKGLILFLVPSIALLGQTLNEWYAEADKEINAICVCSDPTASKKSTKNIVDELELTSTVDLATPATTEVAGVLRQFRAIKEAHKEGMTVVFSTYQSIEVISKVQKKLIEEYGDYGIFDLIICDEAHRTTGVILAGNNKESAFTKVHDNDFIQAKKRMYMTATPRLYDENVKKKAEDADCILCSMDDPAIYGEEMYRIGFGEAVEKNLLSDYKVLVLTVSANQLPAKLQDAVRNVDYEIDTDDAAKLVGCINALSKRTLSVPGYDEEIRSLKENDPGFMHTAVAFCPTIKASKKVTEIYNNHSEAYYESFDSETVSEVVKVHSDHVDGTMGAAKRDEKLSWLKRVPKDGDECRILTNARCLSEGVDVPSLDAVIFLSAKNSQVDVVQSVGRVMRTAPGKKYGYIIIPVIVPADVTPEEALDNNKNFKVVWTVLNALRAHDDRFNAMVNKLNMNKKSGGKVVIITPPPTGNGDGGLFTPPDGDSGDHFDGPPDLPTQLTLQFGEFQEKIYARMVQKVGSRRYWEQWAKDVADIAKRHIERITKIIHEDKYAEDFKKFMDGLHAIINPYITEDDAISMLAQHIITRPVFEALFGSNSFVMRNSVSVAMEKILKILDENAIEKESETLDRFYRDVKLRCEGIESAEGRQKIIIELYDKFFKSALPKIVEKLGIVYTPVEVVDFIINSVSDILKKEFGRDISDENVNILDPFTGTGTFVTRLLQSGRIKKKDMQRKYEKELFANEIVLLAYYIASINIETAYHDIMNVKEYASYEGICLTDTFQLYEQDGRISEFFPKNTERLERQKKTPITVIIGNPPYSIGQKSENDNAKNQSYPQLDNAVANSYVKNSNAVLNKGVYDTYIKSFRWATDRLGKTGGIIGFVTNGTWLDGQGLDGFRYCLEREFSSIYVFNLRGNQRTQGEMSRKEGGKIFGAGSRTPVAITILVKNPNATNDKAEIHYHDIGDYLSREDKLKIISGFSSVCNRDFKTEKIEPDEHNDWLNLRNSVFDNFIKIGDKDKSDNKTVFEIYSGGILTSRDAWCYNSSIHELKDNMNTTIDFYESERQRLKDNRTKDIDNILNNDSKKISWSALTKNYLKKNMILSFDENHIFNFLYRPFFKQYGYYDHVLNERVYQMPKIYPTNIHRNLVIHLSGTGTTKAFSAFATNCVPDYQTISNGQSFPLYWYEKKEKSAQASLFDEQNKDEYIRHDGITDYIHQIARNKYGFKTTKEDIFYYVYGLLHSPDYRREFASNLKKELPRIPLVDNVSHFRAFVTAGRLLADLHLNYETQQKLPDVVVSGIESNNFHVDKMKYKDKDDKSEIVYNNYITISNIPELANEYVVNGRTPMEWIIDRYQITTDKASGIKNDPNDWATEHNKPRYILDLLLSVITVSVKTMEIIKALPKLNFSTDDKEKSEA